MEKISYLKREDNTQKIYFTENTLDVNDILNENYRYILKSMENEAFTLKSDECNLFKEIVFDEKVVGFCSYDFSRQFMTAAMNNIYILPEFRGKRLFLNELQKTMETHNKPSIIEPTRFIVEILIKYGFAKMISENIAASAIEFIVPGHHIISNKEISKEEELSTHFYDLNLCASMHFLDLNDCLIAYSLPLNDDIIHYDCIENRSQIDDSYFEKMRKIFTENEDKILDILVELEENLNLGDYTLEEVIGTEDELSPYIESLIDDAHITYSQALEIKEQIKEEYEAGMILNESLLIRLAYLFEKPEEPKLTTHDDKCPYCKMPLDRHDRFCHFCGINLNYNPDDEELNLMSSITQLSDESSCDEDIRYIAYKFLKTISENIEFEYAVFMTKSNYNIEFEDLKEFLDENGLIDGEKITEDGRNYLKTHPLYFFEKYHMDIVNYNEFEEYYWANCDLNGEEICLNFLDRFGEDIDITEIKEEIKRNI